MEYSLLKENEVRLIAQLYMDYYNECEEGCWTLEKAYKRIHQMFTIEDSMCLVQRCEGEITGFVIGYFKQYDDLVNYYLEEIVIFKKWQNKGLGKAFFKEIEKRALDHGAQHLELTSVNDVHHDHFYKSLGMYDATNLKVMAKHYE